MPKPKGGWPLQLVRTTNPKDVAIRYLATSCGFFMAGGLMAMLMRASWAVPAFRSSVRSTAWGVPGCAGVKTGVTADRRVPLRENG